MYVEILNYNIFAGTKSELINEVIKRKKVNIISGNPEVLYSGLYNKNLLKSFTNDESIIIPDGVGTVITSKLLRRPVKEKIAGIEVMDEIIRYCNDNEKPIYLLGAKEETLRQCILNLKDKYKDLNIAGYHNGYFTLNDCQDIIDHINQCKPFAIFVAMGCPRQETFIENYRKLIQCNVFMGVGGSFDVIAGNVNRAPKWMIRLGLEWLYRVSKEPWRIKRLTSIPKFIFKALLSTRR